MEYHLEYVHLFMSLLHHKEVIFHLWAFSPAFLKKEATKRTKQPPNRQKKAKSKTLIYSIHFKYCGRAASIYISFLLSKFDLKPKDRVLH